MYVSVRDNNVDQALKALKKKMQREGIFREIEKKARERSEAIRRTRKLLRRRMEREGY